MGLWLALIGLEAFECKFVILENAAAVLTCGLCVLQCMALQN